MINQDYLQNILFDPLIASNTALIRKLYDVMIKYHMVCDHNFKSHTVHNGLCQNTSGKTLDRIAAAGLYETLPHSKATAKEKLGSYSTPARCS